MKLTLIQPCVGRRPGQAYVRSWSMEPLAMGVLSALTPRHVERVFYDDRYQAIPYDEPTDLVALSVETYTARRAYQISAEYRRRGVKVVMGGYHPTLCPEDAAPHADAVVRGPAEPSWARVLDDAAAGGLKPLYVAEGPGFLPGLRTDRALWAGRPYTPLSLVETSRGCRFSCEFCSVTALNRGRFEARPVAEVVDELRALGRREVFFVDDNLLADLARARELLRAIRPLGLRWMGQLSVEAARHPDLVDLLRGSGCIGVLIGFESLEQANLAQMGKSVNSAYGDPGKAVEVLRAAGIVVYGTFVFGYDHDGPDSWDRTLAFARKHRLFFTAFNHLVPFPGTPLYERFRAEGRLLHEAWWLDPGYRFGDLAFRPRQLAPESVARLCFEARRRFYGVASVIHRGLDLKANCRDPFVAAIFWGQNLLARREVEQRMGLPLGLP